MNDAPRQNRAPAWAGAVLGLAACYNLIWGSWVLFFPEAFFHLVGMEPPSYPQIWQCLGMVVGVYGVGYAIAATDPFRHWPIVFVGWLGKVLGPLGTIQNAWLGKLPWKMLYLNVTNDFIWWIPFTIILCKAYRFYNPLLPSPTQTAPGDLYRSVLGGDWEALAESLRRFHLITLPFRGEGRFEIQRGPGWKGRILAGLAGMPKSGSHIPTSLQVLPNRGGETWVREFNGKQYASQQWTQAGLLYERMGPFQLAMRLHPDAGELRYEIAGTWFRLGKIQIPIPTVFRPRISGNEQIGETPNSLKVDMSVEAPGIGRILSYRGEVTWL